jgi:hypothetical protein
VHRGQTIWGQISRHQCALLAGEHASITITITVGDRLTGFAAGAVRRRNGDAHRAEFVEYIRYELERACKVRIIIGEVVGRIQSSIVVITVHITPVAQAAPKREPVLVL